VFEDKVGISVTENLRFLDSEPSGWSRSCSNRDGEDGGEDGGEECEEEGGEDGRGEDDMVNFSPKLLALSLRCLYSHGPCSDA